MKRIILTIAILSCVIGRLAAQDFISAEELSKNLKSPNLVIVSAGPEAEYAKVHITNAINLPYTSFDKPGKPEGILISNADMAKILGDKGISEKNSIVVYDEFDSRYAARIQFLLRYLGAKDVKILDGGLEAWKKGRKPVTRNPTQITKTTFNAAPNNKIMASMQDVLSMKPGTILIDTRSPGEYKGGENNSIGHITGAINIDYKELIDANGSLKPKADLEKVYTSRGINKDKDIILYCSSGVRTGFHYLVLVNTLGYTNVKVYDGGYNEMVHHNPGKISK